MAVTGNTFQLISVSDNRFVFHAAEFNKILQDTSNHSRTTRNGHADPFVIISVVGDPGSGKSFILNLINKYLKHNGRRDWIGSPDEVLDGFPWSPYLEDRDCDNEIEGDEPPVGIRMLTQLHTVFESEADHVTRRRFGLQKKVRVIVLDIDMHKKESNTEDHSKIYAALSSICLLLSSMTIYIERIETNTKRDDYDPALLIKIVDDLLSAAISNGNRKISRKLVVKANQDYFQSSRQHQPENGKKSGPKIFADLNELAHRYQFGFAQFDLPNLLASKGATPNCFQGQPKYLDKNALKLAMSRMVNLDTLLDEKYHRSAEAICQFSEDVIGFVNSMMGTRQNAQNISPFEVVEAAHTEYGTQADLTKCMSEFTNILQTKWYYFVIPSTRDEAVQITHNHLLHKYRWTNDFGGNKLWDRIMDYMNSLHPAFRIIDNTFKRLENELETFTFLPEPELRTLFETVQKHTNGKLTADGTKERARLIHFYQHCWLTMLNIINHRNSTIMKFEMKINQNAANFVAEFCSSEMGRLSEESPGEFRIMGRALQEDCLQMYYNLVKRPSSSHDYSPNIPGRIQERLKRRMDECYALMCDKLSDAIGSRRRGRGRPRQAFSTTRVTEPEQASTTSSSCSDN